MTTAAGSLRSPMVLADLVPGARVRDTLLVLGGAGLTGLAAQISINTSLSPVPFTLQTLAVLVTGAALGSARGVLSILLYAVAGLVGVPWFANQQHGWHDNPSFGYVIGFVVAAGVVGLLAERRADRHILGTVGLMIVGNVIIYAAGVTYLYADKPVPSWGFGDAVHYGLTVFLISDAIKLGIAALAFPAVWKFARR
jgi:biotin transport system substrate-specific component